ncbi:MAG: twitching motility protein, partial [uncultured bacterium]
VVLIGEMRDLETIASAMTIAETGHLVFATLHTNSAAQSVDRIIDVFPELQQPQIRLQLAATLEVILSLRLIPTIQPGRTLASEVMFVTPAVRNIIREGKSYLIDNTIETSAELGMQPLERSLVNLVKAGKISQDVALRFALRPELLLKLLK